VLNVNHRITDNNYWTPLLDQVEESNNEYINTIDDGEELEMDKENVAPRYSLPFGGSTSSFERLQERRLLKLKDKRKEKQVLKQRILNGKDPYGWLDSGATSNFIAQKDKHHTKSTGIASIKKVRMANGQVEAAGEQLELKNGLRKPASTADSIPSIKTSLISTSKLADAGYFTVFDKDEVNVYDATTTSIKPTNQAVLTGWRDKKTGLWRVPLVNQIDNENTDTYLLSKNESNNIANEIANNVYDLPSTEQAIRYLHACAGFPTKATWLKAIAKGFYSTWPLLTTKNVNKYFPESEETQKGHMRQKRSGIRSTNRRVRFVMDGDEKELEDIEATMKDLQRKHEDIMVKVYSCTNAIFTDQTGQFPITSSRKYRYIMVMCEIDGNLILVEPLQSRTEQSLIEGRRKLIARLKARKIYPKIQYLDNEASAEFKQAVTNDRMEFQLVTPHMHRARLA
jgi:hypothetical protein